MHFNILTLFPELFPGPLGHSITGRALSQQIWSYDARNIRDFSTDKHKTVDDVPFGGGAGMVMKPDVIERALLSFPQTGRKIYLSPRGKVLNQNLVKELSAEPILTLLCGRYEGVDERLIQHYVDQEWSIGDYVLSGGELPAMVLLDSIIRRLPNVMSDEQSAIQDSFVDGLLDCPQYTKPDHFEGLDVPEVLKSGHHANIEKWRFLQRYQRTKARRPELVENVELSKQQKKWLKDLDTQ